jgi:hypothetical protein
VSSLFCAHFQPFAHIFFISFFIQQQMQLEKLLLLQQQQRAQLQQAQAQAQAQVQAQFPQFNLGGGGGGGLPGTTGGLGFNPQQGAGLAGQNVAGGMGGGGATAASDNSQALGEMADNL